MRKLCLLLSFVLLAALVPAAATQASSQTVFTVVFKSDALPADAAATVQAAGGEVVLSIPEIGVLQAKGGGGFVGRILKASTVLTAGPSLVWSLDTVAVEQAAEEPVAEEAAAGVDPDKADLYKLHQWDIKRVTKNGASFALGAGSHDVVVAVVDSGIYPHKDLAMNLLGGRSFVPAGGLYGDPTETGNPADYWDRNGHGTHCAGTIAANGRVLGVGPDLGLRAYRVLINAGSGHTAWIAAGMVQAVLDGCDVISMSVGGYDVIGQVWWTDPATGEKIKLGNDVADLQAYRRAALFAANNGVVVVSSAGNAALNCTKKSEVTDYLNTLYAPYGYSFVGATFKAPAIVPGIVCVSATGLGDVFAYYSCYGPGFVDLAAPGGDLQNYPKGMCYNTYSVVDPATGKNIINAYARMAGTSMACPKVAAVAALIKWADPKLNAHQITVKLQQSAEDIGKVGTDEYFGFGMVSAFNALSDLAP